MNKFEFKNLSNLNSKQLDFYNFCVENISFVVKNTIPEVCKKFGVGISFVYSFLQRFEFSNFKEFIYYIGCLDGMNKENSLENPSLDEINEIEIVYKIMQQSNYLNLQLFNKQIEKINILCDHIFSGKRIFCVGFGFSKLAISDIMGFFNKLNNNLFMVNDEREEYLDTLNIIRDEDILLVYSARANNKKLVRWVNNIINKNVNIESFLITSNKKSKLCDVIDIVIEVDNIMKRIDYVTYNSTISPASNFVCFNNFLKTHFYKNHRIDFKNNNMLNYELDSWFDDLISSNYK